MKYQMPVEFNHGLDSPLLSSKTETLCIVVTAGASFFGCSFVT